MRGQKVGDFGCAGLLHLGVFFLAGMHFTRLVLLLWAFAYVGSDDVLAVWYACACGVHASFSMAPVLDASVYARMREKMLERSRVLRWASHPARPPSDVRVALLRTAAAPARHHFGGFAQFWFLCTDMNKEYVDMKKEEWQTLMLIAFTTEILVCASANYKWISEA